MASVDFKLDDLRLRANIAELGPKINKYLTVTTDFGATEGVKQMKLNAPWTDRTTNARSGLWTKAGHTGSGPIGFSRHNILFGHSVDYGIWLEIKKPNRGGRPIIVPTFLETGKEVMKTLKHLFDDLDHPKPPRVRVHADAPRTATRSSAGARHRAQAKARAGGVKGTAHTSRTKRT